PRGLPPAVIATAEYDRLRPQAERHAARLRAAGVPVALVTGTGLDHGFLGWGAFARRPAEAVAEIGAAVHDALTRTRVDYGHANKGRARGLKASRMPFYGLDLGTHNI